MREVAYGDTKREIKRCEHDGEEDPPAGHGRDEGEGAACLCTRAGFVSLLNSFFGEGGGLALFALVLRVCCWVWVREKRGDKGKGERGR